MKKLLILAAAVAMLSSCANKQAYVITGEIADLEGSVYLISQEGVIDSAVVADGKFTFKGIAEQPKMRRITNSLKREEVTLMAGVIVEPGKIKITADPQDSTQQIATGTPSNDAYAAFNAAASVLVGEYGNPETTDERREAIEEEYNQLTRTTIENNLDNFAGVSMMKNLAYELEGQEILDMVAKFAPAMQQTEELTAIKTAAEQKLKTDVGQPYIDVIQPNAAGESISLKSVVENPANKYILLDFWASWCSPCMGEVPVLKKTYAEFHDKGFEIYGVSFDRDAEKWQAAIKNNEMNWIHVSEVKSFDNQAGQDYAVQGIPANFLIDNQGKIVAKNLRGEDLYNKIAELLAE